MIHEEERRRREKKWEEAEDVRVNSEYEIRRMNSYEKLIKTSPEGTK